MHLSSRTLNSIKKNKKTNIAIVYMESRFERLETM